MQAGGGGRGEVERKRVYEKRRIVCPVMGKKREKGGGRGGRVGNSGSRFIGGG